MTQEQLESHVGNFVGHVVGSRSIIFRNSLVRLVCFAMIQSTQWNWIHMRKLFFTVWIFPPATENWYIIQKILLVITGKDLRFPIYVYKTFP